MVDSVMKLAGICNESTRDKVEWKLSSKVYLYIVGIECVVGEEN